MTQVAKRLGSATLVGLAALGAALALPTSAGAQGYFGQNQVQYDQFKWKVLETEHFLVHYYPEEREAAVDAARMAERSYARLSRLLDHQFREKKPILLFASRSDFGQNNVTGDLGEFTGAVADALRHRMLVPFTGDYKSFEHVLTHEMVHAFQYDIFARGKAGQGLQTLAQIDPPLWFIEGMAEYLSVGPDHVHTNTVVRDAALNGRIPSIEQMTVRPDLFFPYRYGENLWGYVGSRWGDEVIGQIMNAIPTMGIERAFKRELGLDLDELSDEWKEEMQKRHLPQVATLERARKFSQPLLTSKRSGGGLFVAPALSDDGRYIAFISTGSFLRGEVFPDIWLGDARTGKRIKRLVKSTTDPNFEELRIMYSQSSFSPNGKFLAFTAQRNGKDVLYLLDVKRRKTVFRFDLPLEGVTSPAWSPDSRRLVVSGNQGGVTDLYMVDVDGKNFRQLTRDRYGDLQPQWSPDGKTIAFASDRGAETNFDLLRFSKWRVALLDLETGRIDVPEGQGGFNLNPNWSPDGRSVAYVSDRTGIPNLFLLDLNNRQHYQLTNVVGAVESVTEYSPVISWARQADRLAYVYFEDGDYTIWSIDNPRLLKKQPFQQPLPTTGPTLIAGMDRATMGVTPGAGDALRLRADSALRASALAAGTPAAGGTVGAAAPGVITPSNGGANIPGGGTDSALARRSFYRGPSGVRLSSELPSSVRGDSGVISVAALLDSFALALPDTAKFREYGYKVQFQPEYVARPSVGYAQDNFGRGVFGGTTIVLSDLLGNHRLAFSGQVNGRVSEAQLFAGYTNLSRRFQYSLGGFQTPFYFVSGQSYGEQQGLLTESFDITRYLVRQFYALSLYPLNRFTRFEYGAEYNNIGVARQRWTRGINPLNGFATQFQIEDVSNDASLNYAAPYAAYVSDNTLFGYTGPIMGRRYRFELQPTVGSLRWMEYKADYRRYDPILFNVLTVATRFQSQIAVGRDEFAFPKYIGNPQFIRGYDRQNYYSNLCGGLGGDTRYCNATQLLGSRFALANAELRFPLVRRFDLGLLPISLPPLDGLVFADAGVAWSGQYQESIDVAPHKQSVYLSRPDNYGSGAPGTGPDYQRYPLTSYGFGLRLNLFGFAIVRWDYAIPRDTPGRKGFWTWSLGPSF